MLRAIAVGALASSGCPAADEPRLLAIEPSRVSVADETPAVVMGVNLRAALYLDLDSHAPAMVDDGWTLLVASTAIPDTHWHDRSSLDVTLPRGLPIGTHDVTAVAPDGSVLVLEAALLVVAADELAPDATLDGPRDTIIDGRFDAPLDAPLDAPVDAIPDADPTPVDPIIVEADPFGDGTSFAFVTRYRDHVVVGPNARGTGLVRYEPDGGDRSSMTLRFERDVESPNTADNPTAPSRSIGFAGCMPNTAECGPNNESVRGVLAGVEIAGEEWLVMAGGHGARGLEYLYMSSDTDEEDLTFRYVDILRAANGDAYTSTAVAALGDRLYLGALGQGGAGPLLVALTSVPALPGLDATPQQAISMQLGSSPLGAAGGTGTIDALQRFHNKLYVAHPRGWMRSTTSTPGPYSLLGVLEWVGTTPTASAYANTVSVTSSKVGDLVPADRAVPQMAAFAGRLYVARNTTTGPQLWACTPSFLAPKDCNATNWRLVAPASASPDHTQIGPVPLTAISLVAATSTHLYVGFDSPSGVVVVRTATTTRLPAEADFVTLGAPGLGVDDATQIMDGQRLSFPGDDHVWLTIGSPTTPVTLVKLP